MTQISHEISVDLIALPYANELLEVRSPVIDLENIDREKIILKNK